MTKNYSFSWCMLLIILVLFLAFDIYKSVVLHDKSLIMYAIAAALSILILREIPLFVENKILFVIPVIISFGLFALEIIRALKIGE